MNFSKKNRKKPSLKSYSVHKKLFFMVALFVGFINYAPAQNVSPHAIGIRTGDNNGFNTEVSYQRGLGDNNRIEVDLGYRDNKNFDAWKLSGIYQWVWNIDGGFNWYAGFGGGVGNWDNKTTLNRDDGFFINAAGNIGIEYDFEIPLLISLDFRPEIGLINDISNDDLDFDIALGIRYQF